jgi:hypothetical protein
MTALLLAAALAFTQKDADFAYRMACDFVASCTPRDAGTARGGIAANWILDHASMTGADVRRDMFTAPTPNGERRFVNLYSEFRSNYTSKWVVVVSHFDTKPGIACPGANDGASTTGLLIALANALCEWRTPRSNVMLVWTDGEECREHYSDCDGLQGAKRAVEYIRKKNLEIQAVICLDMLGDRDLAISVPANGSPALSKIAVLAARMIGEEGLVTPVGDIVKDDHVPFMEAGMKAVDLIDFSYGPGNSWWHTPADTCDRISADSLFKSGKLVCEMLNILL